MNAKFLFVGPCGSGKTKAVYELRVGSAAFWKYVPTQGAHTYTIGQGTIWDITGQDVPAERRERYYADADYCVLFGKNVQHYADDVVRVSPHVTLKQFVDVSDLKRWLSTLPASVAASVP